jgi:hypothetical protein
LMSKNAVCGSDSTHWFIDKLGQLWSLTEKGLELLDYREFLKPLVNPIMHYDEAEGLVYISDETTGFVLSDKGLGGGYSRITGLSYISGVRVVTAPEDLLAPEPLHIVTDAFDYGYRGLKSIESIQIGTDTTAELRAAVDYRNKKQDPWRTSPWKPVNNEGVSHVKTSGVEFRIRVQALEWVEFEIDYINVQYKVTDKRAIRGAAGVFGYGGKGSSSDGD